MNLHKRLLIVALSLTLVLSISLSPVHAAKTQQIIKKWSGTQIVADQGVARIDNYGDYIKVTIENTTMLVTKGYIFDNIHVEYEVITSETITIPLRDLFKPSINLYDYRHSGTFEWYDREGNLVGTGTFCKNHVGPPYGGVLSATIPDKRQIVVYGAYWVTSWIDVTVPGFPTTRVPVTMSHAGLYYRAS